MIAAPFRGRAGFAHQPEIPPTVSATKVTPAGAATRSMTASNGPRAAVPASLPLKAATLARRAVAPRESSGLSGWTVGQGGFAAISHTHFGGQLRDFREIPGDDLARLVGQRGGPVAEHLAQDRERGVRDG